MESYEAIERQLVELQKQIIQLDPTDKVRAIGMLRGIAQNCTRQHNAKAFCDLINSDAKIDEDDEADRVIMPSIVPRAPMRVVQVETADEVSDNPIYYISSTGEYATRVAGMLIHGTHADIVAPKAGTVEGLLPCKWGIDCHALKAGHCSYWHPISHGTNGTNNISQRAWMHRVVAGNAELLQRDPIRPVVARIQSLRMLMHDLLCYLGLPDVRQQE